MQGHDVSSMVQGSATGRGGLLVQQLMEHGLCPTGSQGCPLLYYLHMCTRVVSRVLHDKLAVLEGLRSF